MRCPFCSHADTQVLDTRGSDAGDVIRRRRRCSACDRRFTTYERAELALPVVVKKDGTRSEFDVGKLRRSMSLALRKRPVPSEKVDEAIQRVEDELVASGLREVSSERIGELVMEQLRAIDPVAFVRFASVYKSFDDLDEFARAIVEARDRRR